MNLKNYVNEKVKLTTLTPIFIGGDQANDLSPITDFVVEQDKLHIIDQRKFENLLSEDADLVDEYVKQVKQGNFDFKSFIENKLNSTVEELSKKIISIKNYPGQGEIKAFVSSSGNTFIPGSTVKGAIRTAIIYNWLILSSDGKSKVNNILNIYNRIYNADEIIKKKSEKRIDKYWLKKNDPSEREFKKIYNELYLFKNQEFGHDFRHLQISDSKFIEDENTEVVQLTREYLIKDKTKTAPWQQVLKRQAETEFNLKIEKNFDDDFLKPLNSGNYKELFKMINKFTVDFLEFELERFDEFIENGKGDKNKLQETLSGTIDFYEDLKQKVKFVNDMCAVIRIGGGKTYFDNSIGLALYKKDKDKFKQFRKLLGFWKHRSNGSFVEEDSPITRTFYYDKSSNQYLPIGWTVIYFNKDEEDVKKLFNIDERKTEVQNHNKVKKNDDVNDGELDLSKLNNLGRVTKLKT